MVCSKFLVFRSRYWKPNEEFIFNGWIQLASWTFRMFIRPNIQPRMDRNIQAWLMKNLQHIFFSFKNAFLPSFSRCGFLSSFHFILNKMFKQLARSKSYPIKLVHSNSKQNSKLSNFFVGECFVGGFYADKFWAESSIAFFESAFYRRSCVGSVPIKIGGQLWWATIECNENGWRNE